MTTSPDPPGALARLWQEWTGDPAPVPAADDAALLDAAVLDAAVDAVAGPDDGPAAVEVFSADDVLADQLDAFGAVGNVSDGVLADDGTSDVDWTG